MHMKKKKISLWGWLMTGWMVAACTQQHYIEPEITTSSTINLKTSVAPLTRAPHLNADGSGNFNSGDVMSVFVSANGQRTVQANYTQGESFITWDDLAMQAGTREVSFASCYPQMEISDEGTFEFNTHTAEYKDLLLSKAQTVTVGTISPIVLTFDHALHLLNLTFTSDGSYTSEDLDKLSVTCRAQSTCVVNAASGTISEIKTSVADYVSEGPQATFYLVPQPTENITLTIHINQVNKEYSLAELLEQLGKPQTALQEGKRCNIALTIGKDGITLQGGSIGSWGDQVTADGDITIG